MPLVVPLSGRTAKRLLDQAIDLSGDVGKFTGNHGKLPAGVAGARRNDLRIQGGHVRLPSNRFYVRHDAA